MDQKTLIRLARSHGTPLVVVDHKVLRENYAQFRKYLPRAGLLCGESEQRRGHRADVL